MLYAVPGVGKLEHNLSHHVFGESPLLEVAGLRVVPRPDHHLVPPVYPVLASLADAVDVIRDERQHPDPGPSPGCSDQSDRDSQSRR